MTTVTSREFNQDVSRVKREAAKGPVVITDRGKPSLVLMRHDAYEKLTQKGANLVDLLAMEGVDDFEFEPPRLEGFFRPAEFD